LTGRTPDTIDQRSVIRKTSGMTGSGAIHAG
jgi:hypothetical protein